MSEVTDSQPKWYTLTSEAVSKELQVDPAQGLSVAEAAKRLEQYGPNSLTETKEEPTWRAFLRQYKDYMRIYWPEPAALDSTWTPPPVVRVA